MRHFHGIRLPSGATCGARRHVQGPCDEFTPYHCPTGTGRCVADNDRGEAPCERNTAQLCPCVVPDDKCKDPCDSFTKSECPIVSVLWLMTIAGIAAQYSRFQSAPMTDVWFTRTSARIHVTRSQNQSDPCDPFCQPFFLLDPELCKCDYCMC